MLLKLAGAREFGLGVHCFEQGQVKDAESTEKTTSAIVRGSRRHNVQLWHVSGRLEGACDCEFSGGIDFCRHCVALALDLLERETIPRKIDKRASMRRIQRYLTEKTSEELAGAIMDLAGQHRTIRDDLLRETQLASEPLSYTQLKGMIDGIAPVDDWWDFRQVRRYFQALESILARIETFADRIEPLVLLRVVEHTIKRLADIGPLHDLGDYPEDSREMVRALHIETASRLDWAPAELASYLIDCSLRDGWDPFSDAPDVYTNRLGEALHTAIIAELRSRLNALSERGGDGDPDHEAIREYLSQTLEWLTEAR